MAVSIADFITVGSFVMNAVKASTG